MAKKAAQKKPPLGKGRWGWARMMCRLFIIIFVVFLLLEVLSGSFDPEFGLGAWGLGFGLGAWAAVMSQVTVAVCPRGK
jgi:Na+/glutamate symporter